MSKLQVVLDTNVLISAALRIRNSIPDKIYQALKSQEFILITSPQILEEIEEVINREEIVKRTRMSLKDRKQFIHNLIDIAFIVSGDIDIQIVKADPDDDKFIGAALEGRADYIVSGDKPLLNLKEYQEIKVVSPADFAKILAEK